MQYTVPSNLTNTRIWLTHPVDNNHEHTNTWLAEQLRQLGAEVEQAPVFKIAAYQNQDQLTAVKTQQYTGWIFISPPAVINCSILPKQNINAFAVGSSTQKALLKRGIHAITPEQNFSAEGLLSLQQLKNIHQQRWLIVRGLGGREKLKNVLEQRGANVDYLECYKREVIPASSFMQKYTHLLQKEAKSSELPKLNIWIATSASVINALSECLTDSTYQNDVLVTSSTRMVQIAKKIGWQTVFCAENATHENLLACVEKSFN